jgi:hypothetical protein
LPIYLQRTAENERYWQEAIERANKVGLYEHGDKERFWAYVTQVFERLRTSSGHMLKKNGDFSIRRFIKAKPNLLEDLAELEHEQWMAWSRAVADKVSPEQRKKWAKNWKPYSQLSDEEKELDRVWARKTLKRAKRDLAKGFGADKKKPAPSNKPSLDGPGQAVLDSHALIQRPDQQMPVAGRVVAVGKHGVQVKDDTGKHHKVRHEHVLEHLPPITEEEWPEAARALAKQGIPVDLAEQFLPASGGSIDTKTQQTLEELAAGGAPIDVKRVLAEASPEEAKQLIEKYATDEPKPSSLPTVVEKDRIAEAPGWEKVNPDGKGRVSKQKKPPKRVYEADNDKARDDGFAAIKATGLVGKVQVDPSSKPEDQEHLLRTVAETLRSISDLIEPLDFKPNLIVGGERAKGAKGTHVGARYDRHAKVLEIGTGLPESVTHAFGHVVDASYGGGKYGSLDPKNPVGALVESLKGTKGVSGLAKKLVKTDKPEGEANANSSHRFWMSPPEVFARFFEQYIDHSVSRLGSPALHHSYVSGVEQPGSLDEEEMSGHASHFRKKVLGDRDRTNQARMKYRAPESSANIGKKKRGAEDGTD